MFKVHGMCTQLIKSFNYQSTQITLKSVLIPFAASALCDNNNKLCSYSIRKEFAKQLKNILFGDMVKHFYYNNSFFLKLLIIMVFDKEIEMSNIANDVCIFSCNC